MSYVITRSRLGLHALVAVARSAILFTIHIILRMPLHRRQAPIHSLQLLSAVFFLSAALHVAAQDSDSFDCRFSVGELKYDLSELKGMKVLTRTRDSPPSTYEDELRFDLCADLTEVENRASEDQVCLKVEQFFWLTAARRVVSFRHKGMSDHDKSEGG